MDRVYQYMNQAKLNIYNKKTTLELGKHTIFGKRGGGGRPDPLEIHKKKIVSVSLFSTFHHPLENVSKYQPKIGRNVLHINMKF